MHQTSTQLKLSLSGEAQARPEPLDNTLAWRSWLEAHFPNAVRGGFSARHEEFWEWVWSIEPGARPRPFVALWPRGGGKSTSAELAVAAIGLRGKRRYCLYICSTQERANEHLLTIAGKLEESGVQRKVNKYGNSQGWRRERLRMEGFTVDALGLDVASRGKKIDDDRPDLIIFDDIDEGSDTAKTIEKKRKTITRSILPAMAKGCAVLFAQNLIHRYSIATMLSNKVPDYRAEWLVDRIVSGPFKAVEGLRVELRFCETLGANRHVIVAGEPSWAGQSLSDCQEAIDCFGAESFLTESQHEVFENGGALFDRAWFGEPVEADALPFEAMRVRRWDEAATEGGGDWTVGTLVARAGNTYYVEDVARFQHGPTRRDARMRAVAEADALKYGATVRQVGVQDPGSAGVDRARAFKALMVGFPVAIERETGDKALRADGFSKEAGKRNVRVVRAPWNEMFFRELERFPDGEFDDIVDSASGAFNRLSKRRDLNGAIS